MTDEKDKLLCEKYPKIFRDRNGSMHETCMCWGFDHGDGWFNIIDTLCGTIQHHTDWKRKQQPYCKMPDDVFEENHQPVASQVKEKFGGLRFYCDNTDDYIDGAISIAESMSYRICEDCGSPGTTRGKGWIRTICDACNDKSKIGSNN